MSYKRGRHCKVILGGTAVTGLREFSISNPQGMVDTTVASDYYATQLKDIQGPWTASFSGLLDDTTFKALFNLSKLTALQSLFFYPDDALLTSYWYGSGAFTLDGAAPFGDAVNFSGTVDGSAELKFETA